MSGAQGGGGIWGFLGSALGTMFGAPVPGKGNFAVGGKFDANTPMRDTGGPVLAGKAYKIGRPEIFIPSTPGTIEHVEKMGGAGGGGRGAFTYAPTINAAGATQSDIDAAMQRAEQRMQQSFPSMWDNRLAAKTRHGQEFAPRRR
jgi:hypothetical protein